MTDADLPLAAAIYASTRSEELARTGWSEAQKEAFLAHQHAAQHAHYRAHYPGAEWLMIECDGEPAGRLYRIEWQHEIRIIDIALLPAMRGQGIGTALLEQVLAEASRLRKPVTVHVEKHNLARSLYARLGFVLQGDAGIYDLLERRPEAQ